MLGGFTLLQRDLPTRVKRKTPSISGNRGIWSLSVRQAVKVNGSTYEQPGNPFYAENDSLIISTDANPAPDLSRVSLDPRWYSLGRFTAQGDIDVAIRLPGTKISAAPFFQGTAILHVMINVTNVIRVLDPDYQGLGREHSSTQD